VRFSQGELDIFNRVKAALAQSTSGDPAVANARAWLTRLEGSTRLSSPKRIFKVPFASGVIVASTGIQATPLTPFVFPFDCRVVGLKGTVVEGLNLVTHVAVQITDEDGRPMFTNGGQAGQSSVSVPITFAGLQGNAFEQGGFNKELFDRDVAANKQWMFQCTSLDAVPGSGSTTYTPELLIEVELKAEQGRQAV
jgi:hypothetical protein